MNSHLNIFKFYASEDRTYQLENDLTRALAICMQEDNLFFHEILKYILLNSNFYNQLFEDIEGSSEINIDIQKATSLIDDFEHIFAVSVSENELNLDNFWLQVNNKEYDPVCDLVITINGIVIVFEIKRNRTDCTSQLYNQVFNIINRNKEKIDNLKESNLVTPLDLSWPQLMEISVKISSFEKATKNQNRFLTDFIHLIKNHNFRWLPEPPIGSLKPDNRNNIERRIQSTVEELSKDNKYKKLNNRLGFEFTKPWAQEVLYDIKENGDLLAQIYPGNTKGQGIPIFQTEAKFSTTLEIDATSYDVEICYHIKFTSFQKYFSGLWFSEIDLNQKLYTPENFRKYTGRKKRGEEWDKIERLFDTCFKPEFNWKQKCHWQEKIIDSNKSLFDISFGYEVSIVIPFETLKNLDQQKSDLTGLTKLLASIHDAFTSKLLL